MPYWKDYKKPDFLVKQLDLNFEIFNDNEVAVQASFEVELDDFDEFSKKIPTLTLHADQNLEVKFIKIIYNNGEKVDLNLIKNRKKGEFVWQPKFGKFRIETATRLKPADNIALAGLYKSKNILLTQCEAEGFRRIIPYIDRPDVMTVFKTAIIADKNDYPVLLSNGNLVERKELSSSKILVKFEDPFKKPCYLFALIAGKLAKAEDFFVTKSGRKISLQIYCESGKENQCQFAFRFLKEALRWDEEVYNLECDLDEYKIVAASDFNFGAMENKGLNVFTDAYVLADLRTATHNDIIFVATVICHEFFHNYTGNRVTVKNWFEVALKEGMTLFREQEFIYTIFPKVVERIAAIKKIKNVLFPQDLSPQAKPIRLEEYQVAEEAYDVTTTYTKSPEVIRMLQTFLSEKKFLKAIKLFLKRYDGQAKSLDDLIDTMKEVAPEALDYRQFMKWINEAGTPVCQARTSYDVKNKIFTLKFTQNKDFYFPLKLALLDKNGQEMNLQFAKNLIKPARHDLRNDLIHISKKAEIFKFKAKQKPIISILRDFSAPVKLNIDYDLDELVFLVEHDNNALNRYEAGQRFYEKVVTRKLSYARASENKKKKEKNIKAGNLKIFEVFKNILDNVREPAFSAEMMTLPDISTLVQNDDVYDFEAVHSAKEALMKEIAEHFEAKFLNLYNKYKKLTKTDFSFEQVGVSAIKNLSLSYLSRLAGQHDAFIYQEFLQAKNMTDEYNLLMVLSHLNSKYRDLAVNKFYDKWQGNTLITNKWLLAQALSSRKDTLSNIEKLSASKHFDITYPQHVYHLFVFGLCRNLVVLHDQNGVGYKLAIEMILKIDDGGQGNPFVSSRFFKTAFRDFAKLDSQRQILMQKQLDHLKSHQLSEFLGGEVKKFLSHSSVLC